MSVMAEWLNSLMQVYNSKKSLGMFFHTNRSHSHHHILTRKLSLIRIPMASLWDSHSHWEFHSHGDLEYIGHEISK